MNDTHSPSGQNRPQQSANASERTTIPASVVGITLTISEDALRKIDKIEEENIKVVKEGQNFSWRLTSLKMESLKAPH
ncbi:MAG: hypothetical protein OXD01_10145 [Gammaproteobacteria bacterium]|nr:hypothetical protein [Gammaproteobacteria bacterium]